MSSRALLLAAAVASAPACLRSDIDVPVLQEPGAAADLVVHLTASPSWVRTDGTPALVTVVALAATNPPPSLTLVAARGELSVAGGGPASSLVLPWQGAGMQATVRVAAVSGATAGQVLELGVSAGELQVVVTGDTVLPIEPPPPVGASVMVGDEEIEVAAGWSVSLHWDFSADYVYRTDDFAEDDGPRSNYLSSITAIDAPFPTGLAVGGGRKVVVLPEGATYTEYDYAPAANDDTGPDAITDLEFVANWPATGQAAIYLGASSTDSGDGVFRIDPDWSIQRESFSNNLKEIVVDPAGDFDGVGSTALYVLSGGALSLHGSTNPPVLSGSNACIFRSDPVFICRRPENNPPVEIVIVQSVSHARSVLTVAGRTQAEVVAPGVGPRAEALLLLDRSEVADVNDDSTVDVYLRGISPGWDWTDLTVPPPGHPLATSPTTFYLLEQNTALNQQRVLRLQGP